MDFLKDTITRSGVGTDAPCSNPRQGKTSKILLGGTSKKLQMGPGQIN